MKDTGKFSGNRGAFSDLPFRRVMFHSGDMGSPGGQILSRWQKQGTRG